MIDPSSIPAVVSTDWLGDRLGADGLTVLDASWYLPATGRDARAEYLSRHIPGALFFDLDAASDPVSRLPHMLPSPERFGRMMGELGVSSEDAIVVYDSSGANLSAARAWWTFRVFGHDRVAVLDGGFRQWTREGRPVEAGPVSRPPRQFRARFDRSLVRDRTGVRAALDGSTTQLVDARSVGRFAGTEPEPRPGLRSGHIPGSLSLPYTELVDREGRLLPADQLRSRFESAGLDLARPVIATCGSGVTACVLLLGLDLLGHQQHALYDGSWTEWGGSEDLPVETGNPKAAAR